MSLEPPSGVSGKFGLLYNSICPGIRKCPSAEVRFNTKNLRERGGGAFLSTGWIPKIICFGILQIMASIHVVTLSEMYVDLVGGYAMIFSN